MAKRRGRKRKLTEERYPSGDVVRKPAKDYGTAELRTRRAYLAQKGDQARTGYPLGVLWANQIINDEQHRAGCRLAWLYAVVFGRVSLAAASYEQNVAGDSIPDDSESQNAWRRARQRELDEYLESLEGLSRKHRDRVVALAVFEVAPRWMLPSLPTENDIHEARLFTEGIKGLERVSMGMNAALTE